MTNRKIIKMTYEFDEIFYSHLKMRELCQVLWLMPVIPTFKEAEAGGLLEARSSRQD